VIALSSDFFTTQEKSKEFSNIATISHKERAERLFRWKQDPVKALSESATKEQATRVLTAKLRVERLAREARLVAKTRTSRGTTHDDAKSPPF